jgi:geranylgeranyl diphosphate synthase type II
VTAEPALSEYLNHLRQLTDDGLERALDATGAPALIVAAMRYSVVAGGKRLRPCLTLAAAEAAGARDGLPAARAHDLALPAAVAIEMIHTYSLIHDDLPAMDDDALRRGRPTSHVVHGDGLAILAGDGLLTEAFRMLTARPSPAARPGAALATADQCLEAAHRLAVAAGAAGMVGGQASDLAAAGKVPGPPPAPLDADTLADMHARKTGALIRAAASSGAILAGASPDALQAIDDYARELGLAFQIVDDILDVEGSEAALGKTAGKDAAAGKPTYPALFGIAKSRELARECVARAQARLRDEGIEGRLADIAAWSLTRRT